MDYEKMLGEIQGLLGRRVDVVVNVMREGVQTPIAVFQGVLERGQDVDLSSFPGPYSTQLGGETVVFVLQAADGTATGSLWVRKNDFKQGERDDEGHLTFMTGRAVIAVLPADRGFMSTPRR